MPYEIDPNTGTKVWVDPVTGTRYPSKLIYSRENADAINQGKTDIKNQKSINIANQTPSDITQTRTGFSYGGVNYGSQEEARNVKDRALLGQQQRDIRAGITPNATLSAGDKSALERTQKEQLAQAKIRASATPTNEITYVGNPQFQNAYAYGGQIYNSAEEAQSAKQAGRTSITTPTSTPTSLSEAEQISKLGMDTGILPTPSSGSKGEAGSITNPIPTFGLSESERQQAFLEKQKADLQKAQENTTLANKLDLYQLNKQETATRQAEASINASASQGREGAFSTARANVASEFTRISEAGLKVAQDNYLSARNERDNLVEQLKKEQEAGRTQYVGQLQNAIAEANLKTANANATAKEAEAKIRKEANDLTAQLQKSSQDKLDFIGKLPAGTVATMPAETLTNLFKDAGYSNPFSTATALRASMKVTADFEEDKKFMETAQGQAQYKQSLTNTAKILKETQQIGIEKDTQSMQDFNFYTKLKGIDPVSAEDFAIMKGITEKPLSALDKQIKQTEIDYKNAQTAETRADIQQKLYDLKQQKEISGEDGINVIDILSNITENKQTGEQVYKNINLQRLGKEDDIGQCAAFVNDVTGMASKYGTNFTDKTKNINSNTPTAGSIFVSSLSTEGRGTGEKTGHTGFVESVNNDGTVTLVDMNRYGTSQFSRRNVAIDKLATQEGIVGYEDLAISMKNGGITRNLNSKQKKDFEEALIGVTPSRIKEIKQGLNQTLKTGNAEKIKSYIFETQREKFAPRVEDIRKDFNLDIKDYKEVFSKYNDINSTYKAYKNGKVQAFTFDQSLGYIFNKILDPNSVVRESEFNRMASTLGILDRVQGKPQQWLNGGTGLTDKNRADVINIIDKLMEGNKITYNASLNRAKTRGKSDNLPEDFLLNQLGVETTNQYLDNLDKPILNNDKTQDYLNNLLR